MNIYKTIVTRKEPLEDGSYYQYETTSEKKGNTWFVGGDVAEYKTCHYVVFTENGEHLLTNGFLKQA